MGFVTEYPAWFILICAVLAGTYAFILYFRAGKTEEKQWIRISMMVLRFLSVFIIAFLLLSPLIRKKSEIVEKPLIIFAQDNSRSIALSKDSSYYRNSYPGELNQMVDELSKKFEVAYLSFGDKVSRGLSTSFSESRTDISEMVSEVNSRFSNRNIGALIIASDGIYNHGASPFYPAEKTDFPLYTIALGDTTVYRDIILKKINHNPVAYVGDQFPVEILIDGNRVQGERTEVQVMEGEKVLNSRQISFPSEKTFQKVSFLLESKEKGLKRYSVRIRPVTGEMSEINNRQEFYIDITDTRQKVLFLYGAPHPDIAAMRTSLENSARFEVEDFLITDFPGQPEKYDLVVLYQLPFQKSYFPLESFMIADLSLLFVIGTQTNIEGFNSLKTGLTIISQKRNFVESVPSFNTEFSLFTMNKGVTDIMKSVPPLISPFGTYQHSPATEVAFYQKIGNVSSRVPQVFFLQSTGKKIGIIAGENVWKWRLSDFLQTGNHQAFDELVLKIVQYLSVKSDKSFFRLRISNRFMENEEIVFEADVFNESYEPINDPDVNVTITDEQGKQYPFVMARTGKGYFLSAGSLPVGNYKYSASVTVGKNTWRKQGEFFVAPVNIEAVNTIADHNILYRLAREHDGQMVFPAEMSRLPELISSREDIRPVSYIQKRYSDLVGNIVVFLLILGLLTAEWFLRKRSGNY